MRHYPQPAVRAVQLAALTRAESSCQYSALAGRSPRGDDADVA
jgi:hypothetical protein